MNTSDLVRELTKLVDVNNEMQRPLAAETIEQAVTAIKALQERVVELEMRFLEVKEAANHGVTVSITSHSKDTELKACRGIAERALAKVED